MNKWVGTFTKGVATGMAVGTAVGMIGNPFESRRRKNMKKNAMKTMRAVGELVQNAQYMFK